jgi:anti-sigma factor RsiW
VVGTRLAKVKAEIMAVRADDSSNQLAPGADSLNWLAVQYVLGELPESEMTAFEERLASDSVACEAVAAAAQFTLTLQAAVTDSPVAVTCEMATSRVSPAGAAQSAKTAPRGSWLALAGAATAAAGLLAAMSLGPSGTRQDQLVRLDRSASDLVSLWRTGAAADETDADEPDVEGVETSHDVAVPNWLFAAVSLEQGKAAGNATEEWQEN